MKISQVILGIICLSFSTVYAQGKIDNKEIIIYGEREIVLPEVDRNYEKINFSVPRENYPPQSYTYPKGELPPIAEMNPKTKILPVGEPVIPKLYPFYAKAGYGLMYVTPVLELSAANKRNDKFMYVARYKHLSSARGPVTFSGNSNNELELTTKYFNKNITVLADVDYTRRMYHYYGYNRPSNEIKKDTIKQIYSEPSIRFGANYDSKDSTFSTKLLGTYEGLFSKKYSSESDLGYQYSGEYILKKHNVPGKLMWSSDLSIINKTDITKLRRYLFSLSPTYEYQIKGFKLIGGFNIAAENDSSKHASGLHFYPILRASTVPLKGLGVYAGIKGGMIKNTLKTTTHQMPFLERNANIYHTNNRLEAYMGANLNILKNLYISLSGSYQSLGNLPFYINNSVDSSRFVVTYDSTGKTKLGQINVGLSYEKNNYSSSLNIEFNNYKLGDGRIAMHRPAGTLKSSHVINFKKKVYVDLSLWYLWGIKTYKTTKNPTEVKLKDVFDVSLGLKYKLSDRAGVFLDVNNILSQKYERYLYYKSQGINFIIGAFASF